MCIERSGQNNSSDRAANRRPKKPVASDFTFVATKGGIDLEL